MAYPVDFHRGDINKESVAKESHFMLVFTAPGDTLGTGKLRNKIGETFKSLKDISSQVPTWEDYGGFHLALRCERVTLPGRIIVSSVYKEGNYGLNREYPTNAVYQPVDATFLMSADYSEKIFFELWQDLIVGHHRTQGDTNPDQSVKELNYLDNYTCQMSIFCYDVVAKGDGSLINTYACNLQEAYPRTIQDIQMDWSSNELVKLNVVFDYKYFIDLVNTSANFSVPSAASRVNLGTSTGISQGAAALAGRAVAGQSQRSQAFLTGAAFAAARLFS